MMVQTHLLITAKNVIDWAPYVMTQALNQKGLDTVFWLDDASDDGTFETVLQITRASMSRSVDRAFVVPRCKKAPDGVVGALYNLKQVIDTLPGNDIVITWDGDDFFAGPHVAERIKSEYQNSDGSDDHDVWMTYGGYRCWPSFRMGLPPGGYSSPVSHGPRMNQWRCEPPRSFRAGLFHALPEPELIDFVEAGGPGTGVVQTSMPPKTPSAYYQTAWDQALYIPLMELAGLDSAVNHTRYIPEVLYLYNESNEHPDFRVRAEAELAAAMRVHGRLRLDPLSTAAWL